MTFWILDTDCVSLFQRGHLQITRRLSNMNFSDLAVTVITVEEQMRGQLAEIRRLSGSERLIQVYDHLVDAIDFFKTIQVVRFDRTAYAYYNNLINQKIRVGRQDLKIAAIALARSAILVTRNRRDFLQVPGLQLEDWTLES